MVDFTCARHRQLQRRPDDAERLALDPKAFVVMVGFLRECRRHDLKRSNVVESTGYGGQSMLLIYMELLISTVYN